MDISPHFDYLRAPSPQGPGGLQKLVAEGGGGDPGLDIPGLYAQVTSGGQGTYPTNGQVVIVDNFTHGGR